MSLFGKKESESGNGHEVGTRGKTGKRGYGIAETTLLMRTLPVDQNVELVVRVIRNTLESMNVQLPDIIEDAQVKEKGLQDRAATLTAEISEFSAQIDRRRQEIRMLEDELTETRTVKDRLLLAQKLPGRPLVQGKAETAQPVEPAVPPPLPRGINGKSAPELREHAR